MTRDKNRPQRVWFVLLVITVLGVMTKFYQGPGADWVRSSSGGIVYEVFWMILVLAIWPRLSPHVVAAVVFLVTCGLEVLQLWHPPPLAAVRRTFVGHALLGSTFSWWDFPHYFVGCAIGVGLAHTCRRIS